MFQPLTHAYTRTHTNTHAHTSASATTISAPTPISSSTATAASVLFINLPLGDADLQNAARALEGLAIEPVHRAFRAIGILVAHSCITLGQACLLVLVDPYLLLALFLSLALLDNANRTEE